MDVVGKGTKAPEEHPVMEKEAVTSISRTPFSPPAHEFSTRSNGSS